MVLEADTHFPIFLITQSSRSNTSLQQQDTLFRISGAAPNRGLIGLL